MALVLVGDLAQKRVPENGEPIDQEGLVFSQFGLCREADIIGGVAEDDLSLERLLAGAPRKLVAELDLVPMSGATERARGA